MQSSGNCERPTLRASIGIKVRSGDSLNPLKAKYSEPEQQDPGSIRRIAAKDLHITLNCPASVPSESRPELLTARVEIARAVTKRKNPSGFVCFFIASPTLSRSLRIRCARSQLTSYPTLYSGMHHRHRDCAGTEYYIVKHPHIERLA